MVVLRNIKPYLAKLFNHCLKERCFSNPWNFSTRCSVVKNGGERSYLSQYRSINLLSVSKLFEYIINKKVAEHFRRNNLLRDNQYGFEPAKPTVYVWTVIIPIISEAPERKPIDKVWQRRLFQKLSSYGISGSALSIIKSFLKVDVNSSQWKPMRSIPSFHWVLYSVLLTFYCIWRIYLRADTDH